jgi:hypothetical protein
LETSSQSFLFPYDVAHPHEVLAAELIAANLDLALEVQNLPAVPAKL